MPLLAALVLALALAGCGGSDGGGSTTTAAKAGKPAKGRSAGRPALCGDLSFRTTGRVIGADVGELSGLVASRKQPGVLWGIEDSGNSPSLVAVREDGTFLGRFTVPGAQNV